MSRYILLVALLAAVTLTGCRREQLSQSLQQAEQQYVDGEYAAALDSCQQAMAAGDVEEIYLALVLEGRIYLAQGDTDQALASLNKAVDLQPNKPAAYRRRADVWESLGEIQKAAADNALARGRAPDAISSQLGLDQTDDALNKEHGLAEAAEPSDEESVAEADTQDQDEQQDTQVMHPWDALSQEESPAQQEEATAESSEQQGVYEGMPQTPLEGTLSQESPASDTSAQQGGAGAGATPQQPLPQQGTPPADTLTRPGTYQWNDYLDDVLPGGAGGTATAPRTPPTTGLLPTTPTPGLTADGSVPGYQPGMPLQGGGRLSTGIVSDPREVPGQAVPAAGGALGGVAGGSAIGGARLAPGSSALPGTALPPGSAALPGTAPLGGYGLAPAGPRLPGSAALDGGAAGATGSALGPAGSSSPYPLPGGTTPAPGTLPSGTAQPSTGLQSGS